MRVVRTRYLAALVLCLLVVSAALWWAYPFIRSTDGTMRFDDMRSRFDLTIRAFGPERAATIMIFESRFLDSLQQHSFAHAFGASLYAQTGADGFSACPHDFLEGCAHEFVGRALVEHGTSFAETMVSICNASGTVEARCMHSIGHGVLGYFGYDTEALLQALLICGALEHTPWSSCGDGVFMEYNLRLLASGDSGGTLEVRPMDVDAPYEPCLAVPAGFLQECAFELPRWLTYVHADEIPPLRLTRAAAYCAAAPLELERSCFEGLGMMVSLYTGPTVLQAVGRCSFDSISSTQRLYCVTGIDQHFRYWQLPGNDAVCDAADLTGDQLDYCRLYHETPLEDVVSLREFRMQ